MGLAGAITRVAQDRIENFAQVRHHCAEPSRGEGPRQGQPLRSRQWHLGLARRNGRGHGSEQR